MWALRTGFEVIPCPEGTAEGVERLATIAVSIAAQLPPLDTDIDIGIWLEKWGAGSGQPAAARGAGAGRGRAARRRALGSTGRAAAAPPGSAGGRGRAARGAARGRAHLPRAAGGPGARADARHRDAAAAPDGRRAVGRPARGRRRGERAGSSWWRRRPRSRRRRDRRPRRPGSGASWRASCARISIAPTTRSPPTARRWWPIPADRETRDAEADLLRAARTLAGAGGRSARRLERGGRSRARGRAHARSAASCTRRSSPTRTSAITAYESVLAIDPDAHGGIAARALERLYESEKRWADLARLLERRALQSAPADAARAAAPARRDPGRQSRFARRRGRGAGAAVRRQPRGRRSRACSSCWSASTSAPNATTTTCARCSARRTPSPRRPSGSRSCAGWRPRARPGPTDWIGRPRRWSRSCASSRATATRSRRWSASTAARIGRRRSPRRWRAGSRSPTPPRRSASCCPRWPRPTNASWTSGSRRSTPTSGAEAAGDTRPRDLRRHRSPGASAWGTGTSPPRRRASGPKTRPRTRARWPRWRACAGTTASCEAALHLFLDAAERETTGTAQAALLSEAALIVQGGLGKENRKVRQPGGAGRRALRARAGRRSRSRARGGTPGGDLRHPRALGRRRGAAGRRHRRPRAGRDRSTGRAGDEARRGLHSARQDRQEQDGQGARQPGARARSAGRVAARAAQVRRPAHAAARMERRAEHVRSDPARPAPDAVAGRDGRDRDADWRLPRRAGQPGQSAGGVSGSEDVRSQATARRWMRWRRRTPPRRTGPRGWRSAASSPTSPSPRRSQAWRRRSATRTPTSCPTPNAPRPATARRWSSSPGGARRCTSCSSVYTKSQRWQPAIDLLNQLAKAEEDPAVRARTLYTAALILRDELNLPDEAASLLERCLDEAPDMTVAFEDLETLHKAKNDWKALAHSYRADDQAPAHRGAAARSASACGRGWATSRSSGCTIASWR